MPTYDPAARARIVENIWNCLSAGMTLDQIAAMPGWPTRPTLRKWAREDPMFASTIAEGRRVCGLRERHPFDAAAAEALLRRVRLGEPLTRLLGQPGCPHRRALNAWKRQNPAFAADLEAVKAAVDPYHRRYGRRRSRMRFDQAIADRVVLAVLRGATLPKLCRDPTLPTKAGLDRWCKAEPEFDDALRSAMKIGHRARRRARAEAACSPEITERVARRIVDGASLHSLRHEPDMPSHTTLYKWVREHPAFAEEVAKACDFRDWMLSDQACAIAERLAPADLQTARRAVGAINKKLGQLNPHPGQRRREE